MRDLQSLKKVCKQSTFESETFCKVKAIKLYYEKKNASKKNLKLINMKIYGLYSSDLKKDISVGNVAVNSHNVLL